MGDTPLHFDLSRANLSRGISFSYPRLRSDLNGPVYASLGYSCEDGAKAPDSHPANRVRRLCWCVRPTGRTAGSVPGGPAAMAGSSPVSDGRAWRVADGYRSVAGPYASKALVKERTLEAI